MPAKAAAASAGGNSNNTGIAYYQLVMETATHAITTRELVIGRNKPAAGTGFLALASKLVSRDHAAIRYNSNERYFQLELNGKNGVQVNGKLMKPANSPLPLHAPFMIGSGAAPPSASTTASYNGTGPEALRTSFGAVPLKFGDIKVWFVPAIPIPLTDAEQRDVAAAAAAATGSAATTAARSAAAMKDDDASAGGGERSQSLPGATPPSSAGGGGGTNGVFVPATVSSSNSNPKSTSGSTRMTDA